MSNLNKIVYLSNAQAQELFANKTITANGITVTYSPDDLYVTPSGEVVDVRVNGSSVVSNNIAEIPIMTTSRFGVAKAGGASLGINVSGTGILTTKAATAQEVKLGTHGYNPITPQRQTDSVFYGLAKVAGHDEKDSTEPLGTYTDGAKAAIQNMLGITDLLSTEESSTATAAHALNSTFMMNGKLHRATAAIAIGDAVEVGTNCEVVKADEVFVKKTDYATYNIAGLVQPSPGLGTGIDAQGRLATVKAEEARIQKGADQYRVIVPANQHQSIYYGLSKLAGIDLANETVTVGTYPETSKTAIRSLIGAAATSDLSNKEDKTVVVTITSTQNQGTTTYIADKTFAEIGAAIEAGKTVIATTESYGWHTYYKLTDYGISTDLPEDSFIRFSREDGQDSTRIRINYNNTINYEATILSTFYGISINGTQIYPNDGISDIPVATASTLGVVKVNADYGIGLTNNTLYIYRATDDVIKAATNNYRPIVPSIQDKAVFYGLSKAAGVDLASETVTIGTYPETSKTAIRSLIGAAAASDIPSVPVQDVQVNGTSVVSNGVANIPIATSSTPGVSIPNAYYGIDIVPSGNDKDMLRIQRATEPQIKAGTNLYNPVVPVYQHESVFYGLTKAAGVDMASSSNAVGTYTDAAKIAIRSMLGATSSNVIAVQDEQPTDTDTKVWLPETEAQGIQVPTMEDMANYVQKTDLATGTTVGVVKAKDFGIKVNANGELFISKAVIESEVKPGVSNYLPIVPSNQHAAVFYGLAKVAGADLASETVTVGTYPATASAAIRSMLGAISNTDYATQDTAGVVKVNTYGAYGVRISAEINGDLRIMKADSADIKSGTPQYRPIVPYLQHESVFYGLAKAAGDITQSASSNAVGTYTTEAKAAIHTMLGIDPASIAAQVDIPLVETVSGTTPTITGQPNVRYVCGEVSTITITPPASGSMDVIFESGSTATTMTVPSTVKWPAWFDAEALETNTTYEVLITDGIYGSVMTWAT